MRINKSLQKLKMKDEIKSFWLVSVMNLLIKNIYFNCTNVSVTVLFLVKVMTYFTLEHRNNL